MNFSSCNVFDICSVVLQQKHTRFQHISSPIALRNLLVDRVEERRVIHVVSQCDSRSGRRVVLVLKTRQVRVHLSLTITVENCFIEETNKYRFI
jgi:hypothetical protein